MKGKLTEYERERYLRLLKMKRLIGRKLKYWYAIRRDVESYCEYLRIIRSSLNSCASQKEKANEDLQYKYTPLFGVVLDEIRKYDNVISEVKDEIFKLV